MTLQRLSIAACAVALAACGGGSDQAQDGSAGTKTDALISSTGSLAAGSLTGPVTSSVPVTTSTTAGTSSVPVSGAGITDVRFQNTSTTLTQNNVPVTFGQVFAQGALQPTDKLTGRLEDGTTVPLQVDVKATHPDGSVRHAIISAIVPSIAPAKLRTMSLVKGGTAPTGTVSVASLTGTGFTASVHAKVGGVDYYASADELLKSGAVTTWLNGPVATEWEVSAPLHSSSGAQHPHLSARFAIRWYPGVKKARVDVTVENDWAYEPAPQNFTYDASVIVGGATVYSKTGMTHYHHARWRKLFWYNGTEPQVNVELNSAYLIATHAVPNFDQSITVPDSALAAYATKWAGATREPMTSVGLVNPAMGTTGGRPDIGLLPAFSVHYLLTMDQRAKYVMLGTADLSGTWSSHYRDRKTDRPLNVADYPYATVYGQHNDTFNKATGQYEAFPACASSTACATPYTFDPAHQPNLAYLPYIVTGDYYYLEELQFWAMWNTFSMNPAYRNYGQGLYHSNQIRGQAWSMRTAAEAAYITPDNNPLKATFTNIVNDNLDYYNTTFTNDPSNALGALTDSHAFVYDSGTGLAPWQDDFFTSAIGHASDLGFTKANALLAWKSKFPILRMTGTGACWIDAAIYTMKLRDSSTSPLYTTIGQAYTASHTSTILATQCGSAQMASAFGLKVGEMTGYSSSTEGFPSNMQPALAYAANAGGAAGKAAWTQFMARTVKPDYGTEPQFDIVPR